MSLRHLRTDPCGTRGETPLKRGFDAAKAAETTDEIRLFSKVVAIPGTLKIVTADPDDDAVLECAAIGQAQYLVSGDRHLLALGNYQGIQIIKATEFLTLLQNAPNS
jgi:predicted nucleic acid-binding protein